MFVVAFVTINRLYNYIFFLRSQAVRLQRVWTSVRQQVELAAARGRTLRQPQLPVPPLRQTILEKLLPVRPPQDAHRREAVRLRHLRKVCGHEVELQLTPEDAHHPRAGQLGSLTKKNRLSKKSLFSFLYKTSSLHFLIVGIKTNNCGLEKIIRKSAKRNIVVLPGFAVWA